MLDLEDIKEKLNQIKENGFHNSDRSKLSKLEKLLKNSPQQTTSSNRKLVENLKITIETYKKLLRSHSNVTYRHRSPSHSSPRMTLNELSGGKRRKTARRKNKSLNR